MVWSVDACFGPMPSHNYTSHAREYSALAFLSLFYLQYSMPRLLSMLGTDISFDPYVLSYPCNACKYISSAFSILPCSV